MRECDLLGFARRRLAAFLSASFGPHRRIARIRRRAAITEPFGMAMEYGDVRASCGASRRKGWRKRRRFGNRYGVGAEVTANIQLVAPCRVLHGVRVRLASLLLAGGF